ncbi:hypothetical protein HPB52_001515 [Rhipicephalus sanguineus]|uniref:Uncharacterized protein n=1 Tax=Rhipicephalus sanguineus TaxID=34632 RepID=A0A9D4Q464_RHISA|nr:hypothetical protein HPB52_001515 [Rhipicephalus sanguineus]
MLQYATDAAKGGVNVRYKVLAEEYMHVSEGPDDDGIATYADDLLALTGNATGQSSKTGVECELVGRLYPGSEGVHLAGAGLHVDLATILPAWLLLRPRLGVVVVLGLETAPPMTASTGSGSESSG